MEPGKLFPPLLVPPPRLGGKELRADEGCDNEPLTKPLGKPLLPTPLLPPDDRAPTAPPLLPNEGLGKLSDDAVAAVTAAVEVVGGCGESDENDAPTGVGGPNAGKGKPASTLLFAAV